MPPRRAANQSSPSPPPDDLSQSDEPQTTVPVQLLQRIVQEFMEDKKKTRISQPAINAVGEYTKTFIREAIWRAAAIRKEDDADPTAKMGGSLFLEVEDLEKLAPQLLLDF
ncbi:hypothetical protein RUND412_004722 [Rhizina undulata]